MTVVFIVAAGLSGCMAAKRPVPPTQGASVYRVSAPLANLLACPSLTCEVVEDLRDGDQVSVTTVVPGGWVEVRALSSGSSGFMLSRLLVRP
jgi:hypothetical protein